MDSPQPRTARERELEGLFKEFVSMGDQRNYGKLGRAHGIEGMELLRHAKKFLWPERIHSLQLAHNEQTNTARDPEDAGVSEINRLHLTRLKLLQVKAMHYLESCVFDKPEAAMRCLIESMKLEREIKGLTKDKVDDLRSILEKRIQEATDSKAPANEFPYDPNMPVEGLPEDGPQGNPPPPSS